MLKRGVATLMAATALMAAGPAGAAKLVLEFQSSGPWINYIGTGSPFGLPEDFTLQGNVTIDTDLKQSGTTGVETITGLDYTIGTKTFVFTDILGGVVVLDGDNVTEFGLALNDLNFLSSSNMTGVGDADNAVYCVQCLTYDARPLGAPGPIPEPTTWVLMIGGFGLAGAALRQRRRPITA